MRAVVDTNVLFEGLTRLGNAAKVVDAWVDRRFEACVSTALALEYQSVLERKLGTRKRPTALRTLQALLDRCSYVPIHYSVRPASNDPGDDFVVDCVINSGTCLVTRNIRDFRIPSRNFGFAVHHPAAFVALLTKTNIRSEENDESPDTPAS